MEDKTLVFTELNEYVSEDQLRQLKLIFSLRELACNQDIEGSTILLQFKNLLLQKHNWVKDRATPLIQSMLSIVNVREDKVKKLGSDYNILKECKDYLSYPQLVIEFCKGLTFDEFEIFKVVICERILDCTPENVKNCEKVCLMLHQQMKISEQTGLNIFLPYLTKRVDLQEKIKNYATTKKLTESIEETKHDVSNGQANIFVVATMSPIRRTTNTSILLAETSIGSHHKETITSTSSQKQHKTSHFVLPLQETKISQSVQTQRGVTNLKPPYVEAVPHHVEEVPPHFSQTVSFSQFPPSPETSSASTPEHNSERDYIPTGKPEQESGNGVGKPCFDFQSISNSSSPTDSKQTAPKLYPNLTIRLVFPALCAILFLVFLFYVWQCLPCCSTQGLIHSNDNIMFNVTIPGLQDKCVVSVDEEKDATKSPVSIFVPLADSLKFYIDKLNYSLVDAIKKQLQLQSSCATGLIGLSPYFYLSHGSSIDYEICLKLVFVENVFNGKLHVFDSEETFFDYLNTKDCGSHYALKTHNLLLGSDGQYSCTKVHVEADKNGYYFIASKAPANISYYYNYNISKVHLETTDLPNRVCTISNYDANECSIKSSSLHKKTVVFYLHPVGDKDNPINISFSCVCSLEWLGFFYFPDFKTATVWMLSSFTFCCCLFLFTGRI